MIPHSVPEIEGGSPERHGEGAEEEEEGLVLEYSTSWISHFARSFNNKTNVLLEVSKKIFSYFPLLLSSKTWSGKFHEKYFLFLKSF